MPIAKETVLLTPQQAKEIARIERLLDVAIENNPNDVHVSEQGWVVEPRVLETLKKTYEAIGWKMEVQPDRDGDIIWLR